jgi:hypothetical protein
MKSFGVLSLMVLMTVWPPVSGQQNGRKSDDPSRLEQQLSQLEQQWMAAERDRNMDFLRDLWTADFFDVLPGGGVGTKADMLKMFTDTPPKPGAGAFPNDFQLRAVYGNVAIATDHTTIKGLGAIDGEYRCIRMFVKANGKWKAAGSAIVGIIPQH